MSRSALLSWLYFSLALFGLVYSWSHFLEYFIEAQGFGLGPFLQAVTSNPASTGVAIDAAMAGVVFSVMVITCAKHDRVKWPLAYILVTFAVGLCVSLPVYLGFRERARSGSHGNFENNQLEN